MLGYCKHSRPHLLLIRWRQALNTRVRIKWLFCILNIPPDGQMMLTLYPILSSEDAENGGTRQNPPCMQSGDRVAQQHAVLSRAAVLLTVLQTLRGSSSGPTPGRVAPHTQCNKSKEGMQGRNQTKQTTNSIRTLFSRCGFGSLIQHQLSECY